MFEDLQKTAWDFGEWCRTRPEAAVSLLKEGDREVRVWYARSTGAGVLLLVLISLIRGDWFGWLPIALIMCAGVGLLYVLYCATERLFANHRSMRAYATEPGAKVRSYD